MFKLHYLISILFLCVCTGAQAQLIYEVKHSHTPVKIDGDWNKAVWKNIKTLSIENRMGDAPKFKPATEAKVCYDSANVYVIFRVQDKYVKSTVTQYNGNVSGDSCVEFFFSPDTSHPEHYFNLEINAGGTPLMFFVKKPWSEVSKLSDDDLRQIEIAHSMPATFDEIDKPTSWTIECRVPLSVLRNYTEIATPAPGVAWRANFYKTGSETSNPHYYTWSKVVNPVPNFHLPAYFGTIKFGK